MRFNLRNQQRQTFFRKMYLSMTLAMLLPLTLFGIVAYFNAESAILGNEYQSNKKILSQVKYNIDYMNDVILNSVISFYSNANLQTIMYNSNPDFYEIIQEINKLQTSIVNTNPFIDSIYVYNGHTNTYYTTMRDLLFKDSNLEAMLQTKKELPILKPVPRQIEIPLAAGKVRYNNVVSYFMYEFKDVDNRPSGSLVVNASMDWILNNIKTINSTSGTKQDRILILDSDGNPVETSNEEADPLLSSLKNAFLKQVDNKTLSNESVGYFTDQLGDSKYLITYTYVDKMQWTIIKAQRYNQVFSKINAVKITFVVITIVFLGIGFIISLVLSRRLYRPIGQLVKHIVYKDLEQGEVSTKSAEDEFSYLNEVFQNSLEQLAIQKQRRNSEQEILKTFFWRKLLVDSNSISSSEIDKAAEDFNINFNLHAPHFICIAKIDNYEAFKEYYTPMDQALCAYGITNISLEWISKKFASEAVEIKNDYMAFLIAGEASSKTVSDLVELWQQAQQFIEKYYRTSISISISHTACNYREVSERYFAALEISSYRLIFGKSSVITEEMVKVNANNPQFGYSASSEKKLIDALKYGNISDCEEALDRIFNEMRLLSYNNALLSVMNLLNTLKITIDDISRAKVEPIRFNIHQLTERIFALETLDELYDSIASLLKELLTQTEKIENEKQSIIVDTMKELIESNYANPELCLQFVTDKLNLSSKSVSKLFSSRMGMSVSDYITEIRLSKAVEWLENSNLSVKEVLAKIGMENESYFYKLFRKKYGTTPKEFILNRSVKQIQSKIL